MLVLEKAGLVFLANPKTATQALRAMLARHAIPVPGNTGGRHVNARLYARRWAHRVTEAIGRPAETVAVMREPLAHLESWYRYRQRPALRGHENATHGLSFAEFIEALLSPDPPPFARIGRQDRFLGFLEEDVPPVDYIFDFDRLDLLVLFLSDRLGTYLTLPVRNVSPPADPALLDLPPELLARLKQAHASEFDLYERVADMGVLETRASGDPCP